MEWSLLLWQVHLAATWFMVGLIWFVQIVHYPQFDGVGPDGWAAYHRRHLRGTTWVVLPAMLVELATGILLLVVLPTGVPLALAWVGMTLLAVVWGATFLAQVPRHNELAAGTFEVASHRRLCRGNWVRTACWTLRGLLLLGERATAA